MKNLSQNFNQSRPIFILGLLIIFFLVGGFYLVINFDNFQNQEVVDNKNEISLSINEDISSLTWVPLPYFSKDINLLIYYPEEWEVSSSLFSNRYNGEGEGDILSFSENNMYDSGLSFLVEKYFDTGETFNLWVNKKIENIKDTHGEFLDIEEINNNGIQMKKICSDDSIAEFPSPACFVYFHKSPYIIEIKLSSYNSKNFNIVEEYTDNFAKRIYLLDYLNDTYDKFVSYNMGYEISYHTKDFPPGDYNTNLYHSFGSEDSNDQILIQITTGQINDLEKYWFDETKYLESDEVKIPYEVYIDNTRCLMTDVLKNIYGGDSDYQKVYCFTNNKLYTISVFGTSERNKIIEQYSMLASIKFNDENKIAGNNYYFIDNEGKFRIQYPESYSIYEEYSESSNYFGFNIYYDNYDALGLNVSYQETELSLEECVINTTCLIYSQFLIDANDTSFLGISAKELITADDNRSTTLRDIIFKKDGVIYNIGIIKKDGVNTTGIDKMLDSFEFL